ncbi:type II secretion system F family protein [Pseudomonas sp. ZM23]|uniref:Type II secretion system F family protein n=1 Tax=Pseudomonas triclosanedens TaxID=2961893 RepID=A0ABY7A5N7_9PSED|nr:type II secretion system F family protein [Pseudomonas triclosanedens]MCP8464760.1 type II secretion system F family protein [Pseudomonas triclosanedens]MCP8470527.1 type II secretion system F family protein [Pseudomonas triclosanedens]MCP8476333.1 type II secretion system F family protein [Pseudomonas triclosanedens]WAI51438.1 type II secretion system F family protein [Pseudomonas triclosanedens]
MRMHYVAIDRSGKQCKGEVNATSRADGLRQLEAQGLTALRLEQTTRTVVGRNRRLRAEELNLALYELATLLAAGVSLAEAVEAQERSAQHPRIAAALRSIGEGLRQGQPFPQVLEAAGLPLPRYAYQLVAAGEMTGNLATALRDCVSQMEYERRTRDEIRNALIYPAILVLSGIGAVAMMFVFVVPKFANLLEHADRLPWLAWAVLSSGVWCKENAVLLLVMLVIASTLGVSLAKSPRVRSRVLSGLLHVPLLGDWLLQAEIAQWSKVLGTLLGNRVALVDALRLSAEGVRIPTQRELLERVTQDVRGGAALSLALENRQAITATGGNLVRVGEKSGRLADMLDSLAELYEEQGRSRMRKVLALVEPLAILLIGGIFGVIITGVVLAITSANDIVL